MVSKTVQRGNLSPPSLTVLRKIPLMKQAFTVGKNPHCINVIFLLQGSWENQCQHTARASSKRLRKGQ